MINPAEFEQRFALAAEIVRNFTLKLGGENMGKMEVVAGGFSQNVCVRPLDFELVLDIDQYRWPLQLQHVEAWINRERLLQVEREKKPCADRCGRVIGKDGTTTRCSHCATLRAIRMKEKRTVEREAKPKPKGKRKRRTNLPKIESGSAVDG